MLMLKFSTKKNDKYNKSRLYSLKVVRYCSKVYVYLLLMQLFCVLNNTMNYFRTILL